MKTCNICLIAKDITTFSLTGNGDNRRNTCKKCREARRSSYYVKTQDARRNRARLWRNTNPERSRENSKLWRLKNPDKIRCTAKIWVERNIEKRRKTNRDWAARNIDNKRIYQRQYMLKNKASYNSHAASRRATIKRAIPSWIDEEKIHEMYRLAEHQGKHVDHIVPLQSKYVCGLHWHGDMQLLDRSENIKKGNRHWPDQGGYVESTSIRSTFATSINC